MKSTSHDGVKLDRRPSTVFMVRRCLFHGIWFAHDIGGGAECRFSPEGGGGGVPQGGDQTLVVGGVFVVCDCP